MKFQRKSTIIEANQFHPEGLPWPDGVIRSIKNFVIPTLEGWTTVKSGDWIISIDGKYSSCAPKEFEATYENVR